MFDSLHSLSCFLRACPQKKKTLDAQQFLVLVTNLFIYSFFFLQTQTSLAAFKRRQMRLTTTMCISCLVATILYVIPMCGRYIHVLGVRNKLMEFVLVYNLISCNLNPLANVATIYVMQEDIREAVFSSLPQCLQLLMLKHVPSLSFSNTIGSHPALTIPVKPELLESGHK